MSHKKNSAAGQRSAGRATLERARAEATIQPSRKNGVRPRPVEVALEEVTGLSRSELLDWAASQLSPQQLRERKRGRSFMSWEQRCRSDLIAGVLSYLSAMDSAPNLPPPERTHRERCMEIILRVLDALLHPDKGRIATIERVADVANGALQPGRRFTADVANLLGTVTNWIFSDPSAPLDVFEVACSIRETIGRSTTLSILDGLEPEEAQARVTETLRRYVRGDLRSPAGIIVDLIHDALQRGIVLAESNLSAKSSRSQIAKAVDNIRVSRGISSTQTSPGALYLSMKKAPARKLTRRALSWGCTISDAAGIIIKTALMNDKSSTRKVEPSSRTRRE